MKSTAFWGLRQPISRSDIAYHGGLLKSQSLLGAARSPQLCVRVGCKVAIIASNGRAVNERTAS